MKESDIYAFEKIVSDKYVENDKKIRIIKECMESGVDINYNNAIVLLSAIKANNYEMVSFLIDLGIDIRANNDSALICACYETYDDDNGRNYCRKSHNIFNENKFKIINLLLSLGADVCAQNNAPMSNYIKSFGDITINVIKLLVEYGADPFCHDNLLLNEVCDKTNLLIFEYLISIGANCANIKSYRIRSIFTNHGTIKFVKILLDNGIGPNTIIDDRSLLEWSMCYKLESNCKLLLEYGADINLCHNIINVNRSFFHDFISCTSRNKMKPICSLFLEYGIDIEEKIKIYHEVQ